MNNHYNHKINLIEIYFVLRKIVMIIEIKNKISRQLIV